MGERRRGEAIGAYGNAIMNAMTKHFGNDLPRGQAYAEPVFLEAISVLEKGPNRWVSMARCVTVTSCAGSKTWNLVASPSALVVATGRGGSGEFLDDDVVVARDGAAAGRRAVVRYELDFARYQEGCGGGRR